MTTLHQTAISNEMSGTTNPPHQIERMIVVAVLLLAVFCAAMPSMFSFMIRLGSTPKDPSVGDVTPPVTDLQLQEKRALVVGGTRGVGRGIAITLAKAGASVTVVGRDTHKIIGEISQAAAPTEADQQFLAYSADLSTIAGSRQFVQALVDAGTLPYDYVFFTVGCWPTYSVPFTADGVERVVALDLLSHHVILTGLVNHGLLQPGARVMNTIASTQNFPFQSKESVQKRLVGSTNGQGPGMIPFTLFPIAVAGDAWLREASKRYDDVSFVGMFPGVVSTDLPQSSFPKWTMPILRASMWSFAISEQESGRTHVTVLTSPNVGKHGVSFFNHLLEGRQAHAVALDNELSAWVYEWLEDTSQSLYDNQ